MCWNPATFTISGAYFSWSSIWRKINPKHWYFELSLKLRGRGTAGTCQYCEKAMWATRAWGTRLGFSPNAAEVLQSHWWLWVNWRFGGLKTRFVLEGSWTWSKLCVLGCGGRIENLKGRRKEEVGEPEIDSCSGAEDGNGANELQRKAEEIICGNDGLFSF